MDKTCWVSNWIQLFQFCIFILPINWSFVLRETSSTAINLQFILTKVSFMLIWLTESGYITVPLNQPLLHRVLFEFVTIHLIPVKSKFVSSLICQIKVGALTIFFGFSCYRKQSSAFDTSTDDIGLTSWKTSFYCQHKDKSVCFCLC